MTEPSIEDRKQWMGLLARANPDALAALTDGVGQLPEVTDIRAPEIGLVMVRGRISGSGAAFNFGEMTVTRCTVAAGNVLGHSMIQGRRADHARLAATLDALLQLELWRTRIMNDVINPLRNREQKRSDAAASETAKTRVDFFTLVRGEDGA